MSIFDDNITSENSSIQILYNNMKRMIEQEFDRLYIRFGGNVDFVISVYNKVLDACSNDFEKHGMYNARALCTPVASVDLNGSKILISILYSENPRGIAYADGKIFLQTTILLDHIKNINPVSQN